MDAYQIAHGRRRGKDLFRHREEISPYDELYVMEVHPGEPSCGVFIGCKNPDEHVAVRLAPEGIDKLIGVLQEWRNAHAEQQ
ncbi:hypothetical protein ACFCV8_00845 [Streptomyces sp. NPDC056347]|uniref:hypothetical protein n=1 Tax=Streptomyces sp. NPDC056347 TaxID=3345790 RepID=UPI0035E135B2